MCGNRFFLLHHHSFPLETEREILYCGFSNWRSITNADWLRRSGVGLEILHFWQPLSDAGAFRTQTTLSVVRWEGSGWMGGRKIPSYLWEREPGSRTRLSVETAGRQAADVTVRLCGDATLNQEDRRSQRQSNFPARDRTDCWVIIYRVS